MLSLRALSALLVLAAYFPAASAQSPSLVQPAAPVVVELFTSQSCSSCPPAEAYFRELAARPGLIALEWHVDYWNDLSVAGAGRWRDPFSSPAFTERQRAYNQRLTGESGGYTPQAVVAGRRAAIGSDRRTIEKLIDETARTSPPATINVSRGDGGDEFRISVTGAQKNTEVLLVTYRLAATTQVKGGENRGRTLASAHLVTAAKNLGSGPNFSAPLPAPGEGCAILISEPGQGRILGAATCPP